MDNGGADPELVQVRGRVVDFVTGQPVAGEATLGTSGLAVSPQVTVQGAAFSIPEVPANSVFHVEASVPPDYAPTTAGVTVIDADLATDVPAVSRALLSQAGAAFGVTPTPGRGMLLIQLVNDAGQPRAGIAASSLAFYGDLDARGPFFLSEALVPSAGVAATAAKGWAMYLEIDPALVGLRAAAGANLTIDMPESPVSAGGVTVVRATVTDGPVVAPKNVSFSQTVMPIFQKRGCNACHAAGKGPGRQQGGLTLNDDPAKVYRELVEEKVGRVNVAMPDRSTVLTYPSRETPPDGHPNVTFTSPADPDYQKIRAWIAEGAKEN
ncbi:MAG: hypothetical protein IPI49_18085 [Myxococcales bacterium]|nr:hypothetical protein [Myxococcales bacterium]